MTAATENRVARTLGATFSFYVSGGKPELIAKCADSSDAVVVHGRKGPATVAQMRRGGFSGTVLFDRADYERTATAIDRGAWLDAQHEAGADRLLTSGRWVPWGNSVDAFELALDAARGDLDSTPDVTILLAVDSRWVTRSEGVCRMIEILRGVPEPVALVLSHRDDPLASMSAVSNLQALTANVGGLSFLRADHGAIGAVALGAAHGSTGLWPRYRHFVPPTVTSGGRVQDKTARVFVWDLMDWFTGFTIAGWGASGVDLECAFACCEGQPLSRFLDDRLRGDEHNRVVLGHLARHVLNADPFDRVGEFSALCNRALGNYGPMGKLTAVTSPKRQLEQWAQFPAAQLR